MKYSPNVLVCTGFTNNIVNKTNDDSGRMCWTLKITLIVKPGMNKEKTNEHFLIYPIIIREMWVTTNRI